MKGYCQCPVCKVANILVVVGALNWGLIAFAGVDVVASAFVSNPMIARVIYGIIGVAGVLKIVSCFVTCPTAKKDGGCCEKK